jgi:hypothetical protein
LPSCRFCAVNTRPPMEPNESFRVLRKFSRRDGAEYASVRGLVMHHQRRSRPCVVPRAVPIVEAMAAIVLADFT